MSPVRFTRAKLAAALGLMLAVAAPSRADSVNIMSNSDLPLTPLGTFRGIVTYNAPSATAATLTIQLRNTTTPGGFDITGFGFNDPNGTGGVDFSSISLTSAVPSGSNAFAQIGSASTNNTVNGSPYGMMDVGAVTTGALIPLDLGTFGNTPGIAPGTMGTFTFAIGGTGLNNFSAAKLLGLKSEGVAPGGNQSFVVRFTSNPFSGQEDRDFAVAKVVPAPPSVVLAGLALGMGLLGRFRRRPPMAI